MDHCTCMGASMDHWTCMSWNACDQACLVMLNVLLILASQSIVILVNSGDVVVCMNEGKLGKGQSMALDGSLGSYRCSSSLLINGAGQAYHVPSHCQVGPVIFLHGVPCRASSGG